ncbi:MAG: hypothetical protein K6G26_07025, partial [Lachnospiraceae bacterium]|nr:hypothetical protein [Lachnospiraceae bacterium]
SIMGYIGYYIKNNKFLCMLTIAPIFEEKKPIDSYKLTYTGELSLSEFAGSKDGHVEINKNKDSYILDLTGVKGLYWIKNSIVST